MEELAFRLGFRPALDLVIGLACPWFSIEEDRDSEENGGDENGVTN